MIQAHNCDGNRQQRKVVQLYFLLQRWAPALGPWADSTKQDALKFKNLVKSNYVN